jgi:multidrug resistance efflux pump/GAF domain-containing protein
MADNAPTARSGLAGVFDELAQLRQFYGPPKEFWPRCMAALTQLASADKLVLLVRSEGQSQRWRRLLDWPAETPPSRMLTTFLAQLEDAANDCVRKDGIILPLDPKVGASGHFIVATRLLLQGPQQEDYIAVCLLSEANENVAREALVRLRLAGQIPEFYQMNLLARQAKADVEKFASVLDLTVSVSAEKRFLATAMAYCNGLATRFNCDRVGLGWLERGYVRLRAISGMEKFDRQMVAAQALEVAMEEALDQDQEVLWPRPEGATVISRDHERFARDQKVEHLCSVPLRSNKQPVAVVTCERQGTPFSDTELQQMRLASDLAATRLEQLHQQDRWFGARWAAQVREYLTKLLGPERTWAKLLAIAIVLLLGLLFLVPVPYRVEGNFVLRSDELAFLTAPFEGYIDQVLVRPGDAVKAGSILLKLKTAELELEESFALADLNRYQREAEKARAAKSLAEMRISEAMAEQAKAKLEMVRYRIENAKIKSPFDGVVVEGDLRERLGSPVKAADVLLKVARIDTLYAEAEVNERDVHELAGKTDGLIAFVSQPKKKFPVRILAIEQAAVPRNEANVFLVRCRLAQAVQPWWRPGMSGVCKFKVDRRTLFWILTHRTVDFLRLKLWW